jgi:hypothetical protein
MSMLVPTDDRWTSVRLRCGTLSLRVEDAPLPLEELCTFGSRRNRKRGFLIISKVLGKHVPVRPRVMARIHDLLAERVVGCVKRGGDARAPALPGPVLVLALAETAVGLGQGVFEALLRRSGRDDLLFLHSTRYRLDRPLACTFRESHSHATKHLVYVPREPADAQVFREVRSLVLVDDEISTGWTLTNLAMELAALCPQIAAIHLVSITDWMGDARRREIAADVSAPIAFHSVLRGQMRFEADAKFDPGPLPDVSGRDDCKDQYLANGHGRLGLRRPLNMPLERLLKEAGLRGGERVLVLGTGEFVHAPYRFASHLEQLGWDVRFQSTTRSPVLVGEGIASAVEFIDNYHDDIPNYVYNVADQRYDRILICYETRPLPDAHRLIEILGGGGVSTARALFF